LHKLHLKGKDLKEEIQLPNLIINLLRDHLVMVVQEAELSKAKAIMVLSKAEETKQLADSLAIPVHYVIPHQIQEDLDLEELTIELKDV
jgi:hypothetical protein